MQLKKYIIILTATICVVSLVFVAVYQRCGKAFVADILIGIFSSSFLAFLVSILEYANERRETMEKFYSAALEAIHVINQYRVDYDLDVAIDRVLLIKNYDYSDLDNAYGALKFLFRDKRTKKYIFEKIYDPICQLHNELVEPCHHLSLYKDGVTKNKEVAKANVEKATELLTYTDEIQVECGDGVVMQCNYVQNKLYNPIHEELEGHYRDIMYLNPTRHKLVRHLLHRYKR